MKVNHKIGNIGTIQDNSAIRKKKLTSLVNYVRQRSPFYADQWRDVPRNDWNLSDLPLVDLDRYWIKNHELDNWDVPTNKIGDGIAFKTGGTTGNEKISIYTRREWKAISSIFGRTLSEKLNPGDRVANLFMSGDLYASFIFVNGSLMDSSTPIFQFPFTGGVDNEKLISYVLKYAINVLIIVPARLMSLNSYLVERNISLPQIHSILYGGECIFPEQKLMLQSGFPNANCSSIGCVSVDASLIGASTPDCQGNEHRCFDDDTIVEIIDEVDGKSITEPGQIGKLVLTNFCRKLMPIIRYPTGDVAKWIEPEGYPMRKFVLCGRSGTNYRLRVGNIAIFMNRLHESIAELFGEVSWQIVINHEYSSDIITIRLVGTFDSCHIDTLYHSVIDHDARIPEQISLGLFNLRVECCNFSRLIMHPRSGKLMKIVDQRTY